MVTAGEYDLGVAFDGDADRCLMVDEKGDVIDGDKIMAVCGSYMKQQGTLTGHTIVGTVMSNLGLHEFCNKNGLKLVCTAVGDRNVLEKMLEYGYRIGGEQSGHMIFTDYATTGDGQLTALQFLQILRRSGKKASELAGICPQYPQVLVNVRAGECARPEGADHGFPGTERSRPAGRGGHGRGGQGAGPSLRHRALIRVMVEAKTEEIAQSCADRLAVLVNSLKK